jgi:hypothetical protein
MGLIDNQLHPGLPPARSDRYRSRTGYTRFGDERVIRYAKRS